MEYEEIADISVGTGIQATFGRLEEKTEQLFREFIDNSTSSFTEHKDKLSKYEPCCRVNITWNDTEIIIQDNAYGMNREEFLRAIRLNAKAKQYSATSRSKYGLGLKYAATNLGSWYKIETIEFKSSQKFTAVIDVNDLEVNNPDKLKWIRSDVSDDLYGTKITIRNLNKKLNTYSQVKNKTTRLDELIQNLGQIYSRDLKNHDLELSINGTMIQYKRPEIRENENGNQYYCVIKETTFKHGDKEYKYSGWAAIRKTQISTGAGFALIQQDRAIDLHYLPQDLFGSHNDNRYQRVFGEIVLLGENWTVTFTKTAIKWDSTGLEDAFLISLMNNTALSELFKIAYKLRKDTPNASKLLGGNTTTKTSGETKVSSSKHDSNEKVDSNNNSSSVDNSSGTNEQKDEKETNNHTDENTSKTESDNATRTAHEYMYNNTKYTFYIDTSTNTDPKGNWLQISTINQNNNEYNLDVNFKSAFLRKFKSEKLLTVILEFAIVLVVAQLESTKVGLNLNSSKILIDKVNEILKTENPFN